MPIENTLSARLRKAREARDLSKTEAARLHGVSVPTICYWEDGQSEPRGLEDVVRRYGLSMAEFWDASFIQE